MIMDHYHGIPVNPFAVTGFFDAGGGKTWM